MSWKEMLKLDIGDTKGWNDIFLMNFQDMKKRAPQVSGPAQDAEAEKEIAVVPIETDRKVLPDVEKDNAVVPIETERKVSLDVTPGNAFVIPTALGCIALVGIIAIFRRGRTTLERLEANIYLCKREIEEIKVGIQQRSGYIRNEHQHEIEGLKREVDNVKNLQKEIEGLKQEVDMVHKRYQNTERLHRYIDKVWEMYKTKGKM